MTARTTAHLTSVCDDYFSELIGLRGRELARLFHESQSAAIDRIEAIQETEAIACDFRRVDGFLFPSSAQEADLERELDAALQIGVAVERTTGLPFAGFSAAPALRYARQATFHPLKYLRGLAVGVRARGSVLYRDTVVEKVEETDGGVRVATASGLSSLENGLSWRPIRRSMTASPSTPNKRPTEPMRCPSRSGAVLSRMGSTGILKTLTTTCVCSRATAKRTFSSSAAKTIRLARPTTATSGSQP
ncbi:hypothetical protein AJ87_35575 [Rhizobium yanglingense]|nr:hypothetical protein AJ87_35575 [Rhizobium yanglingense]